MNPLSLFKQHFQPDHSDSESHSLELAAAVLLMEIEVADGTLDVDERKTLRTIMSRRFHLDEEELDALTASAEQHLRDSHSLHDYVQVINDQLDHPQRCQVMKMLWEVAYADGDIDDHEEHMLRRISEMIFLPHSDFIRTKLEVMEA